MSNPVKGPSAPHYEIIHQLLEFYQKFEETSIKMAHVFSDNVSNCLQELKRLQEEKQKCLEEYMSSAAKTKTWEKITDTVGAIASIPSVILSSNLFVKNGYSSESMLLLASATTSAVCKTLKLTKVFEKIASYWTKSTEMQKLIASRIETSLYAVSLGLIIVGLFKAYQTHQEEIKQHLLKNEKYLLTTIGTLGKKALETKTAFVQRSTDLANATLQMKESAMNQVSQNMRSFQKEAVNLFRTVISTTEHLKEIVSSYYTKS